MAKKRIDYTEDIFDPEKHDFETWARVANKEDEG